MTHIPPERRSAAATANSRSAMYNSPRTLRAPRLAVAPPSCWA
jgi:hypothetical protein